ncbi:MULTISPECIES: hypothetical protein [unclassified Chitinophaga]|uniref:hypothetical protein n=1 Tax=unclassified Chitinophaga TaxID=2619133 RepID=UPI0009CC4D68|nr:MULTISPECIES: hypothetical protein [unclassified Chitinophaga]OMP77826.1 hypothetical protein BW716_18070 [[Flexibacter] sp. ATCC 35208]WPV68977.1 hypothetical protein QQL36_09610 [Chitinophaga sp. LS1]
MEYTKQVTDNGGKQEMTLKQLILKLKEWFGYLRSKWLVIGGLALLGAVIGIFLSLKGKPKYVGELTFVMEDNKSGGAMGSYASIASQMGVDLGSGGSGLGVFSGDNIMAFLTSRLMVEKALLSDVTVNGKTTSLADLYIETYQMRREWKDEKLQHLSFSSRIDRKNWTLQQDSVMNGIYMMLTKMNLKVDKPDKKLSFISVRCTSENEWFSKLFTEKLVKEATEFYVETKTQRSRANVDVLQSKADSLERLLNKMTYSAAMTRDLNQNPVRQIATVGSEMVTRDKVMLQTVYAQVIQNLEMSKMSMAQETPIIQIVDVPMLPLKKERLGKLKGIVIGGFLGGFLSILYLMLVRIYREIMA